MSGAPPRIKRVQRIALSLLVLGGMVSFIDRGALAIANPLIRHDLGFSVSQMGLLLSAFLWAYSFSQLPVGGLVDRFRPRRVLALGMVLWSLAQMLGGLVTGFWPFVGARVLLGMGESPQFMTCVRVVRDWYGVRDRGLPNGILGGSSSLGLAVAAPLLTGLMLAFGWRAMFVIMGLAGLAIAGLWYAVYRDPDPAALAPAERLYLLAGETPAAQEVRLRDWLRLFRFRASWGVVFGFFGTVYVSGIYMTWLPSYLEMDRHMSVFKTGFAAGIPFAFGVLGSICGGLIVDFLAARNVSPLTSAKLPVVGGLVGASLFTIPVPEIADGRLAVACISASVFLGYVSTGAAWSLVSAVAPRNLVGSLAGIKNFGGYFGGALAPVVTGFLVEATHSFKLALLIGAGVGLFGACCYTIFVRRPIPPAERVAGAGIAALRLP